MIKAYAKSDIGKVREINQDSYYISDSLDEIFANKIKLFFSEIFKNYWQSLILFMYLIYDKITLKVCKQIFHP